ncbi:PKD domain-containing protein [Halobacteria archaeon HArc-gm2]|nr:PKD domain-containing protein [Halobacteria archaeon HArc-gm2]
MVDNNQETGGADGIGSSTRRGALATFGTAAGVLLGTSGMASAQASGLSISVDPDPPTVGGETTFTGNAAFVDEWRWFIARPDGTMVRKTGQTVTVTFEQTGNYSAGLFAKFSDGEVKDVAKEGTIEESGDGETGDPVANITYSPQDPVTNPVTFDGSGSSSPAGDDLGYHWYRKEGEPDSEEDSFVLHETGETYEATFEPGTTWSVKLKVTDSEANAGTETVTFTPESVEPVANIDYSPKDPVYSPITFDGSGSTVPSGTIESYDWYFRNTDANPDRDTFDNPKKSGETLEFGLADGNTYEVGLEVTASSGDTARETVTLDVIDATPTGVITIYPDEISPTNPVTLDGSQSTTPVGNIVSYEWSVESYDSDNNLIDSYELSGETVEKNWQADVIHDVSLTVTNEAGKSHWVNDSFRPMDSE